MKLRGRNGEYAVGALLGVGGMATVHRGRATEPPFQPVAIKRLHPHLVAADPAMAERFTREGSITDRLTHANVVRVVDVAEAEGGPALVLELVDGGSLLNLAYAAWNRGDPVPPDVASAVVLDVLEALACAHDAASDDGAKAPILHRDVSPHNILIGRDGIAKLADFGIARVGDATGSTETGNLKGKLGYMAPELFGGKKASVRSDLYSVGVVLWELLSSERLFEGEVAEMLGQMLSMDRSRTDLTSRGVATEVAAVATRALDPDPGKRFDSARVMAEALRSALPPAGRGEVAAWVAQSTLSLPGEGEVGPPSSSGQTTVLERSAPPRSRSRRTAMVAALAVALAGGVGWAVLALGSKPEPAAPIQDPTSASAEVAPPPTSSDGPLSPLESLPSTVVPAPVASGSVSSVAVAASTAPATPRSRPLDKDKAKRKAEMTYHQMREGCLRADPTAPLFGLFVVTFLPSGAVRARAMTPNASLCIGSALSGTQGLGPFDGPPYEVIVGGN